MSHTEGACRLPTLPSSAWSPTRVWLRRCRSGYPRGRSGGQIEGARRLDATWSEDDAFFPLEDGRRLAAALPNSQLEVVGQARTFSMIDRPDQLADFAHASAIRRAA